MFSMFAIFGSLRFQDEKTYSALFSDVTGLEAGNFVRVAGVEVGKVKKISIQPDNAVLVEFAADHSVVLTEGSQSRHPVRRRDRWALPGAGGRCGWHEEAQSWRHHSAGAHDTGTRPRRADRGLSAACSGR